MEMATAMQRPGRDATKIYILRCDLGIQSPKFLRREMKDDGEDLDELSPHQGVFEELENDVSEILLVERTS